jgi:hypothetical protein
MMVKAAARMTAHHPMPSPDAGRLIRLMRQLRPHLAWLAIGAWAIAFGLALVPFL